MLHSIEEKHVKVLLTYEIKVSFAAVSVVMQRSPCHVNDMVSLAMKSLSVSFKIKLCFNVINSRYM